MDHATTDALMRELEALLPPCVHEQLVRGGETGICEQTLRRWLVARKMDPKQAAADLTAHAAWRVAWVPRGRIHEDEVAADIAQQKIFMQGRDRHGRGVIILQARKHKLTDNHTQQRYITYVIDGAVAASDTARNPDDKCVCIFELSGIRLANCDAVGLKNIFSLLASHYVERLSVFYMVGAPSIFWGLWAVVSPFIDPVTRSKVVFVPAKDGNAMMLEAMGPEVLPLHLGGSAELVPSEVAWQRVLEQRAQQQAAQQQQQPAGAAAGAAPSRVSLDKHGGAKHAQPHAATVRGGDAGMCGAEQTVQPGPPSSNATLGSTPAQQLPAHTSKAAAAVAPEFAPMKAGAAEALAAGGDSIVVRS